MFYLTIMQVDMFYLTIRLVDIKLARKVLASSVPTNMSTTRLWQL